jgi:hypothetical protein
MSMRRLATHNVWHTSGADGVGDGGAAAGGVGDGAAEVFERARRLA